jgi:serine/threonine-protein kinase
MMGLIFVIALLGYQPSFAEDMYGAISYSPSTGAHGWSKNYKTQSAAEARSQRECESYAGTGDCTILVWFRNACGALAVGPNGYGSGWGATRPLAESQALQSCGQYSSGCTIKQLVCTD